MSYCEASAVRDMLKDDVLSSLLGKNKYLPPEEIEEKMQPKIEEAIADADAEIDGYLNKRYPVPLANIPDMITKISKDIAVYNLMSRSGIDEGEREANYLTRYKAAITYLTKVAEGKLDIGLQAAGSVVEKTSTTFHFSSNTPIFNRNKMNGM